MVCGQQVMQGFLSAPVLAALALLKGFKSLIAGLRARDLKDVLMFCVKRQDREPEFRSGEGQPRIREPDEIPQRKAWFVFGSGRD